MQHMAFCPRQAGLIHLEQVWAENKRTAEGKTLHERVDEGYREFRRGLRQFSGVRVQSLALGVYGRLDVLELEQSQDAKANARFLGLEGSWTFRPVEFKRGEPKVGDCDEVQLCAQAMCVEEMTESVIEVGAIFYGEIRRRVEVRIDEALKARTRELVAEFDTMILSKILPPATWKKGCRACSLVEICQPKSGSGGQVRDYLKELLG